MATTAELEKLALQLPEMDRGLLASALLASLPPALHDDDEGLAEALRRDKEVESNPSIAISAEELDRKVAERR
jgi:hypothetical protein